MTISQRHSNSFCAAKGFEPDWKRSLLVIQDQIGWDFTALETVLLLSNGLFALKA